MFIICLIISVIIVLIFHKKKLAPYLFYYLMIYLCTNLVFECIAHYLAINKKGNYEVYNYEMIFEVSFFLLLFRRSFTNMRFKRLSAIFFFAFVIFAFINITFFELRMRFNANTYTIGCILLLITGITYLFNDIVKREETNPLFFPMFWISLGVLFCYLVNFPFLSNVNQLFILNRNMAENLSIMNYTVNVLMYVLIGIGIICRKQQT